MTKFGTKWKDHSELKEAYLSMLDEKGKAPFGLRKMASILGTSEPTLKKIFGGQPPGREHFIEKQKTDKQLLQEARGLIKEKPQLSLTDFCKQLCTKKERLLRLAMMTPEDQELFSCFLQPVTKPGQFSSQKKILSPYFPEEKAPLGKDYARARRLNLGLRILVSHGNLSLNPGEPPLRLTDVSLHCEICNVSEYADFKAEQFVTIDHIYGPSFIDVKHLRVICKNCHAQTLNHKRVLISIPEDFRKSPPAGPINYKTENVLQLKHLETAAGARIAERINRQTNKTTRGVKSAEMALSNIQKNTKITRIVDALILTGRKSAKCENCGVDSWRGIPIGPFLECHHKNGINADNRLENLAVICPICHQGKHLLPPKEGRMLNGLYKEDRWVLKDQELIFENENYDENQPSIENADYMSKGDPKTLEYRKIYALLKAPNRPPTMSDCAFLLGIHEERFKRIVISNWPSLWKSGSGRKSLCWVNRPGGNKQAELVYNVSINKQHPNYEELTIPQYIKKYGKEHRITAGIWLACKESLLDNYYVQQGLNPFDYPFDVDKLDVPKKLPPRELN